MTDLTTEDEFLTEDELAGILKMDRSTVGKLRKSQDWPHLEFNSMVRYTPEQVAQIIAKHTKTPVDRLPGQTLASARRSARRSA